MVVITRSRAHRTRSGSLVTPLLTLETAPDLVVRRRANRARRRRAQAHRRIVASQCGATRSHLYELMGDEEVLREDQQHLFADEEEPAL